MSNLIKMFKEENNHDITLYSKIKYNGDMANCPDIGIVTSINDNNDPYKTFDLLLKDGRHLKNCLKNLIGQRYINLNQVLTEQEAKSFISSANKVKQEKEEQERKEQEERKKKSIEKQEELKSKNILKIYYNGLKINNGKLEKAYLNFYSDDKNNFGVSIMNKSYLNFSTEIQKAFIVNNDTDLMTDYFEKDSFTIDQNSPFINEALKAIIKGLERDIKLYDNKLADVKLRDYLRKSYNENKQVKIKKIEKIKSFIKEDNKQTKVKKTNNAIGKVYKNRGVAYILVGNKWFRDNQELNEKQQKHLNKCLRLGFLKEV